MGRARVHVTQGPPPRTKAQGAAEPGPGGPQLKVLALAEALDISYGIGSSWLLKRDCVCVVRVRDFAKGYEPLHV